MVRGGGLMTRIAVITGGAGGLGRALARALQADAWHTLLIDQPGPELEALAAIPGRQSIYACDLTDPDQVARTCAEIRRAHPQINLIIYSAGVTQISLFADTPLEVHRKVIDVNYFGAVLVARELLLAVRAARGTHLAISSVAGFSPLYKRTAYAASKHAIVGFFSSLRSEEKPYGVNVLIAAPSFIATNVNHKSTNDGDLTRPGSARDGIAHLSADDAARIILKGMRRNQKMIPVGIVAHLAWRLNRLFPSLYGWIMERKIKTGSSR